MFDEKAYMKEYGYKKVYNVIEKEIKEVS